MTLIGTLRQNRREIAKEMKSMENRGENSVIVWHEKEKGKRDQVKSSSGKKFE